MHTVGYKTKGVFNSAARFRFYAIRFFLLLCKRFSFECTFNYLWYYSFVLQYFIYFIADVCTVGVKFLSFVRLPEQLLCGLTVVYFCTRSFISIYQFALCVNLCVVFIAVKFLEVPNCSLIL